MVFEDSLEECILTSEIGECPIQLVQYDSATLHLSAQDISAHRFLKNQKRIYQELKPQKREILQNQTAVLTSEQLVTFDEYEQPIHSFDLLSRNCQVTCYDLVSSYTESSPFKYALIFSKRIRRTLSLKRNSHCSFNNSNTANSHFHQAVKSLPYRVPWMKCPTSSVESVVILFSQKRTRRVWKQCLKKIFDIKVLNLNKAIYSFSVEHHQQYQFADQYELEQEQEQEQQQQHYNYTQEIRPLNIIKNPPPMSPASSTSSSSSYNSDLESPPSLSTSPTSYYSSPPNSPRPFKVSPQFSKFYLENQPKNLRPRLSFDDNLIEKDMFNQELFQLTTKFNSQHNIIDDFNDLFAASSADYNPTPAINYNDFIPPPHNNPPKFKLPKIPE